MKSFIVLRISGKELDEKMVTNQLGLPDYTYKRGDTITGRHTDKILGKYKEDCWMRGTESNSDETTEMCLNRFLKEIVHRSNYIKTISEIYDVTLWISVYLDDEQNNFHISKDIIKIIFDMGLTLDVSTYFLKNLY